MLFYSEPVVDTDLKLGGDGWRVGGGFVLLGPAFLSSVIFLNQNNRGEGGGLP